MTIRVLILASLAAARVGFGQSPGAEFFETKVRPIFAAKCQACHSPAQRMAGLDLPSAAGFTMGAASGPLVDGFDPAQSRLVRALSYQGQIKMPPAGRLTDEEIASVREWVRRGAPWAVAKSTEAERAKNLWSFQPIQQPAPPEVQGKA